MALPSLGDLYYLPRATISSVPLFNLIAASCYFAVALFLHRGQVRRLVNMVPSYNERVEFDWVFL